MTEKIERILGSLLLSAVLVAGAALGIQTVFALNVPSSVIVGNAAPTVSAVSLNGGSNITLVSNATTSITVNFTVQDANGCGEVFYSGNVTTTVYRSGVSAACSASNLNCYITSVVTAHSCPNPTSSQTSADATSTVEIYYFAQSTNGASSSFSGENWLATVAARDVAGASDDDVSPGVELNVLTALNVTTAAIDYGTVPAGTDTGSVTQPATSTNAGNTTTTLQLHTTQTLTSGVNTISTSSQRYATSTFTYPGASISLSDSPVTVPGYLLTSPSSTTAVAQATFWGLAVPGGTATGTYTGVNVFTAFWQP